MKWDNSYGKTCLLAGLCLTAVTSRPILADDTFYVGGGIGTTEFNEPVFEGDGNGLLFDVGYRFHPGESSSDRPSLEIGLMNDALFSTDISRGNDDDLDLFVNTLYLRHDQPLGDKIWGFGQIGFSRIEVEDTSTSCSLFFNCTTNTNYRNTESGVSWGLGLNIRTAPDYLVSIGYFDYSQSDIDASSWRFTLRREGGW